MTSAGPAARPDPEGARTRRAGGGVVAAWIRLAVVSLIGVAQTPVLFAYLEPNALGVWYLFFALATFINLSDFGLPSSVMRTVAFLRGSVLRAPGAAGAGEPTAYAGVPLGALYASALAATATLGLAFALASGPGALLYFGSVLPAGALRASLHVPLAWFLLGALLHLVAAIPGACLSGAGHVAWDNATRTAANVTGFALLVALVPRFRSLEALCSIYAVQGGVALAGSHLVLRLLQPGTRLSELRPRLALVRGMYRDSAPLFVSRIGAWLTTESTLLVGGYFLGSGRIADFGVLRQLVGIGAGVTSAIPNATSPHTAAAYSAGDQAKVQGMFLATLRYTAIVGVLWTAGLLLWARPVLSLLVGEDHFLGYGVLAPLALAGLAEVFASTHGVFAWSVGRWPFTANVVAGGVLNVVLASAGSALLGFEGLALGSVAAQAVAVYWVQVVYAVRVSAVGAARYAKELLRPAGAYALTVTVSATGLRLLLERARPALPADGDASRVSTAMWVAVGVCATTAAAAAAAWLLGLTRADRAYFLGAMRRRAPPGAPTPTP